MSAIGEGMSAIGVCFVRSRTSAEFRVGARHVAAFGVLGGAKSGVDMGIRVDQSRTDVGCWVDEDDGFCANTRVTLLYGRRPGDVICCSRCCAVA